MADRDPPPPKWPARIWSGVFSELNFYRVHLIYFIITPLVFSGIFYASNGRYHISYIDSLFSCFSAMYVCGLATINFSSLTGWQQTILFIQMNMGNPVFVSWFVVLVRRYYFARKFEHILVSEAAQQAENILREDKERQIPWPHRMLARLRPGGGLSVVAEESSEHSTPDQRSTGNGIIRKLRPDMIRRMDDAPKPVNPSGWVTEDKAPSLRNGVPARSTRSKSRVEDSDQANGSLPLTPTGNPPQHSPERSNRGSKGRPRRRLSDPGMPSRSTTPTAPMQRYETMMGGANHEPSVGFPRHQTVEFAPTPQRIRGRSEYPAISEYEPDSPPMRSTNPQTSDLRSIRRVSLRQHHTINTQNTTHTTQTQRTHITIQSAKHRGFGGFPMPLALLDAAMNKFFPKFKRRLSRTITIPMTTSLVSSRVGQVAPPHAKSVPYISFDAIVGRNSRFHFLSNDQLEEIGGIEYRALNSLLWLVPTYYFGIQLISFAVIGPYMSVARWRSDLEPPNQVRSLSSGWFSLFQVVSSFSNTGTSLVDQSVIPFQKAYALIVFQIVLILGGNCAYPILLRLLIWTLTKLIPRNSRLNETLHFLLDHPRRCYTHLFPSHQTWFLLTIVLLLTSIDWGCFMLLDIGNSVIDEIPLNTRFAAGLFQAVAVRAAGFAIVPLNSLAPAVKSLYMIMMYISIYPIAMSVRSTNVYEEQSLGIFEDHDDLEEEKFQSTGPSRVHVWSRYLAMHARRQLAFDMWWLCIALILICILERHHIINPENLSWFNIFNVMFEIVSAYGTVGLSLGIPDQNYSLSGAFRPLSKLIICLVMLRGRHRGLPVAIDRAILLPSEYQRQDGADETSSMESDTRSHHTQSSYEDNTGYPRHSQYSSSSSIHDSSPESLLQRRATRRGSSSSSGTSNKQRGTTPAASTPESVGTVA